MRTINVVAAILLFLTPAAIVRADTYSTFQTTRFYSANGQFFVEVAPNKRATLYSNDRRLGRVWSRTLTELPSRLFVANDGQRVVMIDYYYGNNRNASASVVLFFDESGNTIATHTLANVANLPRVLQTTSSAHWYYGALITADQTTIIIETSVRKCDPPRESVRSQEDLAAVDDCMKAQPFEELRFSMATGALTSRVDIQTKYSDRETRLLHDLELVESEHPPDKLSLAYSLVELAHFYEDQGQYVKANEVFERAIPIYCDVFGANYNLVAQLVGYAATNYRRLGDYHRAEVLFRRALTSIDRHQGNPAKVSPQAIPIYEEYAVLLRQLSRNADAEKMERRANVLRSEYPGYKTATTR